MLELNGGRGADLVVKYAGVPSAVVEGIELFRWGGTVVDVGNIQPNTHRHLRVKNIRLIGQMNLDYIGKIPSILLLVANRDRHDFDRLVTHLHYLMQSLEEREGDIEGKTLGPRDFSSTSTDWNARKRT